MGSKTSVIIYITLAILLLLLISHSPNKPSHRRPRRLKLRSNFSADKHPRLHPHHDPVAFDPLVADIERHREDKQWEKNMFKELEAAPAAESQPEWEDFMNAEDYLNDEEKFNITDRLVLLFPKIDVYPPDGYATEQELTEWIVKNSQREVMHRTQREMELHDKNRDGLVSFSEYQPPSWVPSSDNSSFGYEMGWWREGHFNASDEDGDGFLNITEFNNFQHPADSKNPKLLHWLCQEEIRERDSDKDGKVNFKEFFHGLFDYVRNYDEEGHNSSHESDDSTEAPARKLFAELDKNGDGYLSDTELLPVIGKLHPSEHYYAKQQADYIISQALRGLITSVLEGLEIGESKVMGGVRYWQQIFHYQLQRYPGKPDNLEGLPHILDREARDLLLKLLTIQPHRVPKADTDKDGRLTMIEMIDSPYVFYSAIFSEDDEDGYEYHDEFR